MLRGQVASRRLLAHPGNGGTARDDVEAPHVLDLGVPEGHRASETEVSMLLLA